jgi:hypothetical protein
MNDIYLNANRSDRVIPREEWRLWKIGIIKAASTLKLHSSFEGYPEFMGFIGLVVAGTCLWPLCGATPTWSYNCGCRACCQSVLEFFKTDCI